MSAAATSSTRSGGAAGSRKAAVTSHSGPQTCISHGRSLPAANLVLKHTSSTSHHPSFASRTLCRASEDRSEGLQEMLRNEAAKNFAKGVKQGKSEDELVAEQFGAKDPETLSDTQKAYVDKVKENLAKRAAELERAEAERPGNMEFEAGKELYGVGRYVEAEEIFMQALDLSGPYTKLGGEIQLWLALAYQANRKEELCIELYKSLEDYHPIPAIKKQAYELRFIMEAPKIPLKPEDKVTVPVIEDGVRRNSGRSYRPPPRPGKRITRKKSLEEEFLDNYTGPQWVQNRYVQAATVLLCIGLAWYSTTIAR